MAGRGNDAERGREVAPMDAWEVAARHANETMRAAGRLEELCRKARTSATRKCGEGFGARVHGDVRDAMVACRNWTQQTNGAVREALRDEVRMPKSARELGCEPTHEEERPIAEMTFELGKTYYLNFGDD